MKRLLFLLILTASLFSQTVLPISIEIMKELRYSYNSGEIDEYIRLVTSGQNLSEDDYEDISYEVERFFDSDQFLETGGAYLSALFNERELDEILAVMRDSSLRYDPNFGGAARLEQMMQRLKPYIVKYLRHKTK